MATSNNTDRTGTLPAPHEHVTIRVAHWFNEKYGVLYTARPAELRAAGLVTPYMEEKILNQRAGHHVDDNHYYFRLQPAHSRPGHWTKRALWESGEPIVLCYPKVYRARLPYLPGIRELYPDGIPRNPTPEPSIGDVLRAMENADDRTVSWLDRCAVTAHQQLGGKGDILKRERAVGRFQRLVTWASVGGILLIPDFVPIRAAVMVNRTT